MGVFDPQIYYLEICKFQFLACWCWSGKSKTALGVLGGMAFNSVNSWEPHPPPPSSPNRNVKQFDIDTLTSTFVHRRIASKPSSWGGCG